MLWICPFLVVSAVFVLVDGFSVHETAPAPEIAGEDCEVVGDEHELLVTGYCNCGKCCGWRKKWFFFGEPVYDYGNLRGTPKKVGVTASGAVAAKGTIAADPTVYPFGTRIWIPGYGSGTVQDIGGSIKGAHIDIWFPSQFAADGWCATSKLDFAIICACSERSNRNDCHYAIFTAYSCEHPGVVQAPQCRRHDMGVPHDSAVSDS